MKGDSLLEEIADSRVEQKKVNEPGLSHCAEKKAGALRIIETYQQNMFLGSQRDSYWPNLENLKIKRNNVSDRLQRFILLHKV